MSTLNDGTIQVFTFKEGLLSRVAHDLQFHLERWEVTVEDGQVTGRFRPADLRLDGAVKNGRVDPGALKPKDRAQIERNVIEVLKAGQYSEIGFRGTLEGDTLRGELTMTGRAAPIECRVTPADGGYRGRVELKPTRWGIPPYKALMGAIKLQDRVEVAFDVHPG